MMTALTMVGLFQRSWVYSISPFQDLLSPNKVIPLTVCIAEWNVRVCVCVRTVQCAAHTRLLLDGNVSAPNKAPLYYLANFA